MISLDLQQKRTLEAFCETIHPRIRVSAPSNGQDGCAVEWNVDHLVEKALYGRSDDNVAGERFCYLLKLLNAPWFNGIMSGHWAPFCRLSLEQRTGVLRSMANSHLHPARAAFHSAKQLVSFLYYAGFDDAKGNPLWPQVDYCGFAEPPGTFGARLPVVAIDSSTQLDCDVLVVGSGAGGGVVAAELAAAGHDVLVVEKGAYYSDEQFPNTELEGMRDLYEGRGGLKTVDSSVVVLAGSTVGGGTAVNWTTALRPPPSLLASWSTQYGFSAGTQRGFEQSIEAVQRRLHVTTEESTPNAHNTLLERGCHELGYGVTVVPRNTKDCVHCAFCGFGCRHGSKQDTRNTFLRDATQRGARILPRAYLQRLRFAGGAVVGGDATVEAVDGHRHAVEIRAKTVVVAAGTIHTPALLLRSGLGNRNLGRHLHLHPTAAVFARYEEPVYAWQGAPQTRICEHFADLDGHEYGFRLEVCPAHPGLWALGLPWQSGHHLHGLMQQLPHLANTIILTRDRYAGRITVDRQGRPRIHYQLHSYDAKHLMRGVLEALRVHRAAGARDVYGAHNDCLRFDCSNGADFETYLEQTRRLGTRRSHIGLFCAHQLSSCRMAASSKQGVVNPEGESYEVRNLYVADGSVLPTATGVNPMLTIFAMAHHIAQHIK